jgi:hypothetical protein
MAMIELLTTDNSAKSGTARKLDLSGDEAPPSRRTPVLRVNAGGSLSTILLPHWNAVHLLEQVLRKQNQFHYLAHYERTPYEVVEASFWRGKNEWVLGSNSKTSRLWAHCKMPGGHGFVIKL